MEENPFDRLKLLVSEPSNFFEQLRGEGLQKAFFTYLVAALLSSVIGIGFFLPFMGLGFYSFTALPMYAALSLFVYVIGAIIYAGMVQVLVKLFGGTGTYKDTFNVFMYSMSPAVLIAAVPYIGLLGFIYGFVLAGIGMKKVHEFPTSKAVVATITPVLIGIVLLIIFVFWVIMMLVRAF